jgi:adenosylcobinamide-GDP ribazoletransferase
MNAQALRQSLREQAGRFFAAVMLLTRVPVGAFYRHRAELSAGSVFYFPVVGFLIGLVGAGSALLGLAVLPAPVAIVLSMLVTVALTGAFHEDGLADAADGLLGGNDVARRLEIMKDSRLGTFGALALWFSLTAKLLLLCEAARGGGALLASGIVVAHTLARGSSVALLGWLPYVRGGASKAAPFCAGAPQSWLVRALIFPLVTTTFLPGGRGIGCVLVAAVLTFAAGKYFRMKIGGVTGDCLGAANQIVELGCYVVMAAQVHTA